MNSPIHTHDFRGRRVSVEKTISSLALLVSALLGVAVAFGWVDPDRGQEVSGSLERLAATLADNWSTLALIGALWYRKRLQEERR